LDELMDAIVDLKGETGKDVVLVLENRAHRIEDMDAEMTLRHVRHKYQQNGIPVFANSSRALAAIKNAHTASMLTTIATN